MARARLRTRAERAPARRHQLGVRLRRAPSEYNAVWKRLFPWTPLPTPPGRQSVVLKLVDAARGSIPLLYVLERRIERGFQLGAPGVEAPQLPPRTATEHFVVVEAVTDTEPAAPVVGLRLELLIADGEVRTAQTDVNGIARVERIQAGRVVIRVLDVDGALWWPAEGAASQASGGGERPRVHRARQGECLSKVAHRYQVESWQRLWDAPDNDGLRKRRRTLHLLLPGDEVSVPSLRVHELIRPTDATHRIIVSRPAATFQAVLQDHNRRPFKNQPYELSLPEQRLEAPRTGTTDDRGSIVERLPPETQRIEVRLVRLGLSWSFALSEMVATPEDEVAEASHGESARLRTLAAQARLNALGFACGAVDGKLGPRTRAALAVYGAAQSADGRDAPEELAREFLAALHDEFLA